MEFEGLRRRSDLPNLTPLIDIVFLLLVFFMLTAHFVEDEAIPLQLPAADSGVPLPDQEQPLLLTVDAQGRLLLQQQSVSESELLALLQAQWQTRSNRQLTLKGDAGVALGQMVRLLDIARQSGAAGVDIVTRKP